MNLSKCLADSDLVVIGLTGIGPIRKISVLDWFLPYWPNESFYIVLTDHIKANTSKLINNTSSYIYACLPCDVPKLNIKDLLVKFSCGYYWLL